MLFGIECAHGIGYKALPMQKRWLISKPSASIVSGLKDSLGLHPVVATLLANRNICSPEQVEAFLHPRLSQLRLPTGLKDMETAVRRIAQAVTSGEPILLFGDYDVDGTTATALLYEFLTACDASVSYYVPHRLKEGYGLKARHIAEVAIPRKTRLLITVDCGSTSHAAAEAAAYAGIDLIITDHHTIGDRLPQALAVVNPKRPDCSAGFEHLSGVGVAFCLTIVLRRHLREAGFWKTRREPNLKSLCDLVALGTIADLVPLVADNRILAKAGIEIIASGRRLGLSALMETAGIAQRPTESDDVAFRLGPRLNAAGRIDHAVTAVELLTTNQPETARRIARTLNGLNADRQDIERNMLADIQAILARQPELLDRRTIVLAHSDWHEGVIGVVASKMMEMYCRPVVLIALKDGSGRGSARSIPGIDLFACLSACRMHLDEVGGHKQAAGLHVAENRLPAFRQAFEQAVAAASGPEPFIPHFTIDCLLDLNDISEELVDRVEAFSPFGVGNPEPLFMARDVVVASSAWIGDTHRRMTLRPASGSVDRHFRAIQFHAGARANAPNRFERLLFKLRWNRWNGAKTIQLLVEAAHGA